MFEQNDRNFVNAKKVLEIIVFICCISALICGVVLISLGANYNTGTYVVYGVELIVGSALGTWLAVTLLRLLFSYLYDVKAIRNALYKQNNDAIDVIYAEPEASSAEKPAEPETPEKASAEKYTDELSAEYPSAPTQSSR